jgi:hypothetical protein
VTNRGDAAARRESFRRDSASRGLRGSRVRLVGAAITCLCLWSTVLAAVAPSAQQHNLRDVLDRLDAYLERYESSLATVVAEERYWQTLEVGGSRTKTPRTRVLVSDYALARAAGGHAWTGFRDTYEVDGMPVRDREQRLLGLIADGSDDSARQALRISRENARYNLGEDIVARTINVPTVALDFIHPRHRSRLSFEKRGEEVIDGVRAWVLSFRERDRPTLLRTPDGRDRRAHGAVWIDPATGEVWRTDLSWDGAPEGMIVVHYRRDERIGALVPDMMLEEYRGAKGLVLGKATYANYRRFETAGRVLTSPEP